MATLDENHQSVLSVTAWTIPASITDLFHWCENAGDNASVEVVMDHSMGSVYLIIHGKDGDVRVGLRKIQAGVLAKAIELAGLAVG